MMTRDWFRPWAGLVILLGLAAWGGSIYGSIADCPMEVVDG